MDIEKLASEAFISARQEALEFGLSVFQSENGAIYEVFPNGDKIFIKSIEPPIYLESGSKFIL